MTAPEENGETTRIAIGTGRRGRAGVERSTAKIQIPVTRRPFKNLERHPSSCQEIDL
jgi:hypothetical protein